MSLELAHKEIAKTGLAFLQNPGYAINEKEKTGKIVYNITDLNLNDLCAIKEILDSFKTLLDVNVRDNINIYHTQNSTIAVLEIIFDTICTRSF